MDERLHNFLQALPEAAPDRWVTPPGLGPGQWKAKHIRSGMARGVLVVHHTGAGLAFRLPASHGACPECASAKSRSLCEHCNCTMCVWEREVDERSSPRVPAEKRMQLRARIAAMTLGAGGAVRTSVQESLSDPL